MAPFGAVRYDRERLSNPYQTHDLCPSRGVWDFGYSLEGVRILRQIVVLILLLASCLAPAMACMIPSAQMTTEERACCRMMHNRCEQMGMPASHGCCQKAPQSTLDKALITNATNYHPVAVAVVSLAIYEQLSAPLVTAEWINRPDYSPPQFPPGSNSILRI
jgi:hypothetical protein